jgi:O-methyltransferase involved in polyketide biosynthesis
MAQVRNSMSTSLDGLLPLLALQNAIKTEYANFFLPDEKILINHLIETILQVEPSYFKWGCEIFFNKGLPYASQRQFLNLTAPGYTQQVLAKKHMIKLKIEDAIAHQKVEQIVFLTDEYDPQAFNIARKQTTANIFELVTEKIAKTKRKAFLTLENGFDSQYENFHYQSSHTRINANYNLITFDFANDKLAEKLITCGFNSEKKTLFIAEGFNKQLSALDNMKLLKELSDLSRTSHEILISYCSTVNPASFFQYLAQTLYQFAITPEQIPDLAAQNEFQPIAKIFNEELLKWLDMPTDIKSHENFYLLQKNACIDNSTKIDITKLPLITENLKVVHLTHANQRCALF